MKGIHYLNNLKVALFVFTAIISSTGCEPKEEERLVYKPNIYIHPENNMNLQVSLNFPQGGRVVSTIPEYGDYWDIFVDTSGLINNTYHYLFYESSQPDRWQRKYGWIIEQENLRSFFKENLAKYYFNEPEIDDFINYWIPRLKNQKYYVIYPQTNDEIDPLIELFFSLKPDHVQRLFYFIAGSDVNPINPILEPSINSDFIREGFFVVEWGVIL
ncbi:MAG: hypothetical protein R6W31_08880 [Bacteroidales bacterium]